MGDGLAMLEAITTGPIVVAAVAAAIPATCLQASLLVSICYGSFLLRDLVYLALIRWSDNVSSWDSGECLDIVLGKESVAMCFDEGKDSIFSIGCGVFDVYWTMASWAWS